MPEVTVFVLSVDSARMLEDALDCVAAQTFHDVEIFVVEHADEPAAPPRPGVGVVQASSSLIPWTSTGSAPWIAFLRSDDRWRPRALERVLRRLHLAHETAAAGPEADLSTLVIRRDTLADLGGVSH